MVTTLQQILYQGRGDNKLLVSYLVEQILYDVGKPDDRLQPKQPCGAFDGVSRTEDGTYQFAIIWLTFQ